MGLAGATVAPRGTPIARMRAKVKLRQVVSLPLSLCFSSPSIPASLFRPVLRCSFFPILPRLLRFLEVTSFPRETICDYGIRGES